MTLLDIQRVLRPSFHFPFSLAALLKLALKSTSLRSCTAYGELSTKEEV